MAPINFLFTMTIMVTVSLLSEKPAKEKTEGMTLTREFFRDESAAFKKVRWYSDFRLWSLLLVLFCFVIMFIYR